jgi:hypothetical protein
MSNAIIDGTNIDTSVFSYSAPKANPSGGKVVNLYNKNFRESLTISTPLMLTWGAQEGMDQQKNPTGKFTMSLQFPNKEYASPDADAFLASMRALEAKVKADAMVYSKEWFGKEIKSADVMDEKFNIMLKHPKKEKGSAELDFLKPPTLSVKIPCWKGVWQSEIYDEEGEPLFLKGKSPPDLSPLDFLKSKTQVICLIQCGGLWFINGKVSMTWNLKQAIVQKPKTSSIVEGMCFLKPKPSDKEKLKAQPPPEVDGIKDSAVISSTIVDDSDDEEDMELPPPPQMLVREQSFVPPAVEVPSVVVEEPVVATEEVPVVVEESVVATEEVPVVATEKPKKRVISKKKVEA